MARAGAEWPPTSGHSHVLTGSGETESWNQPIKASCEGVIPMEKKLTRLGVVIAVFGLAFFVAAGYAFVKVQDGQSSLNAFSAAQAVTLSYNDQGQLVDHGDAAAAQVIMDRLTNEWGYAVNPGDFNSKDPVVNTASEYMYEMATITTHTLDSVVTLPADVKDADGNIVAHAGDKVAVDGRYYAQFDRTDPVAAQVRTLAWSPLALSLIGQLGVGAVTSSTLQMGLGLAGLFAGVGFMFVLSGIGLVWVARPEKVKVPAVKVAPAPIPA
jgi:hypothetical protein